jgi:hypothetical protein
MAVPNLENEDSTNGFRANDSVRDSRKRLDIDFFGG